MIEREQDLDFDSKLSYSYKIALADKDHSGMPYGEPVLCIFVEDTQIPVSELERDIKNFRDPNYKGYFELPVPRDE